LAIARNFASQGIPKHLFQFSYDLPGYGGYLRAVHTGDTAGIFHNLTDDVLRMWPGYNGTDRAELRRIARSLERCTVRSSVRVIPVQPGPSLRLRMGPSCGLVTRSSLLILGARQDGSTQHGGECGESIEHNYLQFLCCRVLQPFQRPRIITADLFRCQSDAMRRSPDLRVARTLRL
jgi:hypothetical protein